MAENPQIGLYSIAGSYRNPDLSLDGDGEEIEVAFGGYFKAKPSEHDDGTKDIKGQIIDMLGPAVIEGEMSGDRVNFTKRYEDSSGRLVRDEVGYQLRPEGESHIGTYTIHPDLYQGPVIAKISKVVEDASGLVHGPLNR